MAKSVKHPEPKVILNLEDLSVWYFERTNRFPKNWRVSIGDRIEGLMLDLLTLAHLARIRSNKKALLVECNEKLDLLRVFSRICLRLGCLQTNQYEYVSRNTDEIGRQIGGWIKQQAKK